MNPSKIEAQFRQKVAEGVTLREEGRNRFLVFTPFMLDDGDELTVVLKRESDGWVLSDEGHTYMHLTYTLDERDIRRGTRQKIISNTLSMFAVEDLDGELRLPIREEDFGDSLFSFVQALLRISDVSFLSRERAKSTFLEDVRALLDDVVPSDRRSYDWHDPQHDPNANYTVDCRINGLARPIMVFALPTDSRVKDATIALLQFKTWGLPHRSLAIFEDQEDIGRKVLARFTDVGDRQFSSLGPNRSNIERYIREAMAPRVG